MKRPRLVPSTGVEIFQVRVAYWYDEHGHQRVTAMIDETAGHEPSLIEVLGTLRRAESIVTDMYEEIVEDG